MRKTFKVLAMVALTVLIASQAFAQITPETGTLGASSATKASTSGIFRNDIDNFMSYDNWSKVLGDSKQFVFAGLVSNVVNLGYALDLGGLYLGALYKGNILKLDEMTETDTKGQDVLDYVTGELKDKTFEHTFTDADGRTANGIGFIVGIGTMAIKAGFYEDISWKRSGFDSEYTDTLDGWKNYPNGELISRDATQSLLAPSIGFGINLDLGSLVIKPSIDAAINIGSVKDYEKGYTSGRVTYEDELVGDEKTYETFNNAAAVVPYITPQVKVDIAKNENTTLTFGLKYTIGFASYATDYEAAGFSGSVKGVVYHDDPDYATTTTKDYLDRVEKTRDSGTLSFDELSSINNTITPSFKVTSKFDKLKLGFDVQIPFDINSSTSSKRQESYKIETVEYKDDFNKIKNSWEKTTVLTPGEDESVSYFKISPSVNLGAQYPVVDNRFTVNAGVNLKPLAYERTTVTTKGNGVVDTTTTVETKTPMSETTVLTVGTPNDYEDKVSVKDKWDGLTGTFGAGCTFTFNKQFALDCSFAQSFSGNSLNVGSLGSIMLSMKF